MLGKEGRRLSPHVTGVLDAIWLRLPSPITWAFLRLGEGKDNRCEFSPLIEHRFYDEIHGAPARERIKIMLFSGTTPTA